MRAIDDLDLMVRRYHCNVKLWMQRPQLLGKREAILAGHVEVEQHEIGRLLLHTRQCLVCIGGFDSLPIRIKHIENSRHRHACELAVINDQYLGSHKSSLIMLSLVLGEWRQSYVRIRLLPPQ